MSSITNEKTKSNKIKSNKTKIPLEPRTCNTQVTFEGIFNDEPDSVSVAEKNAFEAECHEKVKKMMKEAKDKADKYPKDFWNDELSMEEWFAIGH